MAGTGCGLLHWLHRLGGANPGAGRLRASSVLEAVVWLVEDCQSPGRRPDRTNCCIHIHRIGIRGVSSQERVAGAAGARDFIEALNREARISLASTIPVVASEGEPLVARHNPEAICLLLHVSFVFHADILLPAINNNRKGGRGKKYTSPLLSPPLLHSIV